LTIDRALAIIESGVSVWDYNLPTKYDQDGSVIYMVDSIENLLKKSIQDLLKTNPYIKSQLESILGEDADLKKLKKGEFLKVLFKLSKLDVVSLFNYVTNKLGSSYNNLNGY
jgi:hypothetical protein